MGITSKRATSIGLIAFATVGLAGCSTLPASGPTARSVKADIREAEYDLVEILTEQALPSPPAVDESLSVMQSPDYRAGVLASGDIISVTMYEVGARLFSGRAGTPMSVGGSSFDPSATAETIGPIEIGLDGMIRLPYIAPIRAEGKTITELQSAIVSGLRGKSENPQVIVTLNNANGSGVVVSGEVGTPGRVRITGGEETLLDAIALAGGYRGTASDLSVRLYRRGQILSRPMETLSYANVGSLKLEAGDRIEVVRVQQGYTVLGSAARSDRYALPTRPFSLAEALASAGGLNEAVANPGAVFVFRYLNDRNGSTRPTVYHVNMMKAQSYFLAQRFVILDQDVVYIANADANQPAKLLQIIGQVFTPAILARQVLQ